MESAFSVDSDGAQHADEQAVLKNFLKDNIDSKNPATRITAIQQLDVQKQEHHEKLIKLAQSDSDPGVRDAAIAKINDAPTLARWSFNADQSASEHNIQDAARQRLGLLLAEPDVLDEGSVRGLLPSGPDELKVMIACHSAVDVVRDEAILQLTSQQGLADVITESRFHASRELAAERLTDLPLLEKTVAAIKTRDKVVARRLQDRLDAAKKKAREAAAHQEEITQLTESMKTLADSVWSPQYAGRFTATSERWSKLSPAPSEEQRQHYTPFLESCAAKVEEHKHQQQAEEYCAQASQQLVDLIESYNALSLPELASAIGGIRQKAVDIAASWKVSVAVANPDKAVVNLYESRRKALQTSMTDAAALISVHGKASDVSQVPAGELGAHIAAIEAVIGRSGKPSGSKTSQVSDTADGSKGDAPQTYDCQAHTDAAVLLRTLTSRQKQQKNEDEAKLKSIQKQLGGLAASIKDGKWSPASSLYSRVEKKLSRLQDGRQKQQLTDQLEKHKAKLDELADWQDFASRPKLEALCEQMEQVPSKELAPLDQAALIKQLQDEWKSIGPSRCANEFWPRFKTAGDAAYEPVGAFYAARREERESRQKNKDVVCDRLTQYLGSVDWETADWKGVEKILRVAKKEWRDNRVTDRKPDKALEQRFTDLVGQFNEKLSTQYDANAAYKEELIEKVKKLAEAEINQHSVNQTKRLQNSWKQSGIMRRRQDQELWEQFNGHCREIYKQHRAAEKEKTDAGLEHVHKARELVRNIKALSKAGDPDEKSFSQLQEQFNALPEFPEKDRKYLLRDFNQASEQFNRLREQSSVRAAQAEMVELQRRSGVCEQLELLVNQQSTGQSPDQQKIEALESEWDETAVVLPKKWLKLIQKRKSAALDHLKNGTVHNYNDGEQVRRLACIKAEIIGGSETPAEDRQTRMAYQLEQLQQGIAQSGLSDAARILQELIIEWASLPPALPENRDQLESRFQTAVKH